jgi:hypothetical protein
LVLAGARTPAHGRDGGLLVEIPEARSSSARPAADKGRRNAQLQDSELAPSAKLLPKEWKAFKAVGLHPGNAVAVEGYFWCSSVYRVFRRSGNRIFISTECLIVRISENPVIGIPGFDSQLSIRILSGCPISAQTDKMFN